jgi:hypothetical protein
VNPFDQAARYAAKQLDAEGFLRWLLPEIFAAWRWDGWLDTQTMSYPGEPDRRSDTVAAFERLSGDAPPVAAVLEFQSRLLGPMLERLAEYALRLRRELPHLRDPRVPYTVVGVLVNLTGPAQAEVWTMTPPDFGDLGLQFRVRVRTLREEDAPRLLTDIEQGRTARCLLPWVPLMRGGDRAEIIELWKRLASAEVDVRKRGDYGGLARVFAELSGRREAWTKGLEGWNVEVSQVVLEWQAQALARGRNEGIAEGMVKGRDQGIAEGRAEMLHLLRERVLRLLRKKFQTEPAADLVAVVQGQTDPALLGQWLDLAFDASSLEEVRSGLDLS